MKVVIAHNMYASGSPSGENTIVDTEISQLRAAGVKVIPFIRSSDEIADMSVYRKALLPLSPVYNGPSQRTLGALLGAHHPDVLHLHNPYPLLSPWVIRTAHRHGVPVVQTVHNYRQVCASGLYFREGAVCRDCAGRRFGFPAIRHACYRDCRAQSAVMATALAGHRATWRSVDQYIALTSAIADHLREYGIPADRISVKPNAVADPGPPPAEPGDGFLFAARLTPEKGLSLLLDAWQAYPVGALGPLRIAGDGPLRPLAEAAAAARDDIAYLGQCGPDQMRAAIRSAACVVATPTWHDVLPTVALEAFASGRPVLATRMGGLPYLVGPSAGETEAAGWVVDATVDGVREALATARDGAAAQATAARRRYQRLFSPDIITGQLVGIYAKVAST
ncbi:MAG: glycosyltransferase family 4 protein [Dactylosporangium sp.]|nr:glycosyltransferase family 4 protein [Dactylosporangium sp.]NNJ61153.1 glycosyltransferase family 4 protein [Dactylosporangium sp.]